MKTRVLAGSSLAALALAGCGAEDVRTPPEEGPGIGDPEVYFGLKACTCFEYVPDDANSLSRLGVAVESVTDIFTPGQPMHILRYRVNGLQRRVDFVDPTDPDLNLHWVGIGGGDNDLYWQLDAPLPFLRFPAGEQDTVTGTANAVQKQYGQETGEATPVNLRVDYAPQTVEASLDGGGRRNLDAIRLVYQGTPWPDQVRWFLPEVGFVKQELELGEGTRTTWILNNIRTLAGGCDPATGFRPGDPIPPTEICGTD